jgi:quercetin dioxygenase-like cupin family protein
VISKYPLSWAVPLSAAAALLIAGSVRVRHAQATQPAPISRTDLQRHDLSIAGHQAIQVRVDFASGAIAPRHRHPGEEMVYVLNGTLDYRLDGRAPVTLRAGDVLFIPAETVHAVTNVGGDNASELATYVVETGKPLVELVQ